MILESGLGTMSVDWANVQPEVAKTTRVCATTERVLVGVSQALNLATPNGSPVSCTPCSTMPGLTALTYWWGSRSAACMCGCKQTSIRRR